MDLSSFKCRKCGSCCRQRGYVRLKDDEPDRIAHFLCLEVRDFNDSFTILTQDRTGLSLIENENGDCIFLTDSGCKINPVKPRQCLEFPLKWKFKDFAEICAWARVALKKSKAPEC